MGRKESYNQGIAAGIKISEEFVKNEKEAIEHLDCIVSEITVGHEEIKDAVNKLITDANDKNVANVFNIIGSTSPNDLKDYEKKMVLDIIATLITDDTNAYQKEYYNNLRHCVNIIGYNPNSSYDFRCIEEIETISSIKMIAEVVRTYLFLTNMSMDEVNMHEDDLFSHFELKSFDQIDAKIELLFSLFGKEGLIERYGHYESIVDEDIVDEDDNLTSDEDEEHLNIEVADDYQETYEYIFDQLVLMPGKVDIKTKKWIDNSFSNISESTAVAVYHFPKDEVLFTLCGLYRNNSSTDYSYILYDEFDDINSFYKKAVSDKYYDTYTIMDNSEEPLSLCVERNEAKVLQEMLVKLKDMPKPSDDKIVSYRSKEHENYFDYILLMVEFLKIGNLEPFFVMRLFSDIIDYEDVDQDVFEEMAKIVLEESRAMTKEQFIERARYLIYNEKLASRYNNTLLFINDLVVLLQYATGKVSQYNGLYSDILRQIYEISFDEDDSTKYDDFIRICEMPYKFINYLADMDELRKCYNNIDNYADINHIAFVDATKAFWVGVMKILDQDYGIFTSKDKRMGLLRSLFNKRWNVEKSSYLRLLGRINNIKDDKIRNLCYKRIDSIITYPDEEMNEHFCELINEYKNTNLGPEEIIKKYKESDD